MVENSDDADSDAMVIKDFTIVPEGDGVTFYFGSLEADILIFDPHQRFPSQIQDSERLKLYHVSVSDASDMTVPLLIIELKRRTGDASEPTTDDIRTRSEQVRELKETYPFLGCSPWLIGAPWEFRSCIGLASISMERISQATEVPRQLSGLTMSKLRVV